MLIHGRYQVEKQLGEGAFGITYLVRDTKVPGKPRRVLKQLKVPTDQSLKVQEKVKSYFEREAEKLGELGIYDQIPNIFDYFQEKDEIYLVQEFVQGQSLADELHKKRLSEPQTLQLLQEILAPLAIVHQHNVIHRDLKPDNIIRRQRDKKLVLIDFGAVKTLQNDPTLRTQSPQSTWAIGTPGYMPDEQSKGHPRFCSDVYAVGMIGIEALTEIPPHLLGFNPDTLEVDWQSRVQVSPQMQHFIGKMVRYDFRQRYGNAQEALKGLLGIVQAHSQPTPPPPPVSKSQTTIVTPSQKQLQKTPSVSPVKPIQSQKSSLTRRKAIQVSAFGGVGFLGALLANRWLRTKSTDSPNPEPVIAEDTVQSSSEPIVSETPAPANNRRSLQTFDFETVTVNDKGEVTNRQQKQAEYFTEDLGNGVQLEMVAITGGIFLMGSPPDEQGRRDNESPQHQVTVKSFYMGRYPTTQTQWQAVMGNNSSSFQGNNRPVERISWNDAVEFCKKLSQSSGRLYRLPSEAEWEYACRASTTTPFHFGNTITTELVNYDGSFTYADAPTGVYREETTPVGQFLPNDFGLYDMHGNVWEWCQDVWHEDYTNAPIDSSAWTSGENQRRKILRGGSCYSSPKFCRSAFRNSTNSDARLDIYGFRVVCAALETT